jgi:hypothetical protein
MVFRTPTNSRTNELEEKGRLILLKEHSKDDGEDI